jgi:hypothetical protein
MSVPEGEIICRIDLFLHLVAFQGIEDLEHDSTVGFQVISTDDIDDLGIPVVISKIRQRIGNSPVYLR